MCEADAATSNRHVLVELAKDKGPGYRITLEHGLLPCILLETFLSRYR